jgi:phytoene dehydrogenase-like protein
MSARIATNTCLKQIGRHTMSATDFEAYNSNLIGGDISGGLMNLRQTFARPSL